MATGFDAMKFVVKIDQGDQYFICENPEFEIVAGKISEVIPALQKVEALQKQGFYVAGWISYEAATAFDSRQKVLESRDFPLVYFLASKTVKKITLSELKQYERNHICHSLQPHISQNEYEDSCSKVLHYIYEGDIYQANYSFRCDAKLNCHPFAMFQKLENEHPVPYSIYVESPQWQIISQSPELFLKKSGTRLLSQPMKGTASRELTYAADENARQKLRNDQKSQSENVMIVDLMRNDFGKICQLGSVKVPELFISTRYHSLHQLTSLVEGELLPNLSLLEILKATFPAGSVTGAPKIRAMEIIAQLEKDGRRLYTGSAGIFFPDGDFILNVCIRTLVCKNQQALLGIGSGIVADSAQNLEWEECLLKSRFLNPKRRHTEIFETMLWWQHIHYLEEHLIRLEDSCDYFLIPFNRQKILEMLNEKVFDLAPDMPHRLRLAVKLNGEIELKITPLEYRGWKNPQLKIKLSDQIIDSSSPYQYHKTDYRELYNAEYSLAIKEGYDEVIFLNEFGKLAEGAVTNIFLKIESQWITPPISAGILNGTWRQNLLAPLKAKEENLSLVELKTAEEIIIGNSVRMRGEVKEIFFKNQLIWHKTKI